MIHGYAYALDNNLEVDDDSLFKMIPESNNTWNEENNEEEMYQNEPTNEDLESPMSEPKESPQQEDAQLDSNQVQRDYHEDVIIVDDDPTERKDEDPVEKIVDQDGDDDWSRAI